MAAPTARARADYDYLIKLLLIGDSEVEMQMCVDFSAYKLSSKMMAVVDVSQRIRSVGKSCLLLRFSDGSFTTSFITTIGNWIRNIEQHASDNVNKILVGNKADMDESKRVVPTSKGQALADEYGIKFFETSAKTNLNVEEVFFSIARDIKQRLADTDSKAETNQEDLGKLHKNRLAVVEDRCYKLEATFLSKNM
ncbi:unnamed protein product [Sphenostylis stenocarpa]|uniref:Uncharacterized protein n=1 Tax=Sphenostylis stenocarpa TaxID=92480 RepID=A0AA86RZA3_9FABA|nr:unnamed protein product [Sphenostylis stenocarpa]